MDPSNERERVWTVVPWHPVHAPEPRPERVWHVQAVLDDMRTFVEHTISIAREVAEVHTRTAPARWLGEWGLDVYESHDEYSLSSDARLVRRYRFNRRNAHAATPGR